VASLKATLDQYKACPKCNFQLEHHCQLEIDHIDGNKKNNAKENLQILCANCHTLKTYLSGDIPNWTPKP